jgi:hypothetical protein
MGHWPLDVIKRFVLLIVIDAIECLVEGGSWKCSQTALSRGHLKTYFSKPNWLTALFPQVQRSGSTFHMKVELSVGREEIEIIWPVRLSTFLTLPVYMFASRTANAFIKHLGFRSYALSRFPKRSAGASRSRGTCQSLSYSLIH